MAMGEHGVSQEWQTQLEWHAGGFWTFSGGRWGAAREWTVGCGRIEGDLCPYCRRGCRVEGRGARGLRMDAGRPMGTPVVLVAGAGGLACPSSLLCSVERLCLFKRVLEGSVPEAWDDRDCLPLFVEGAESLAASQRPELWAPPEAAGERRPDCPVPRASLSAAGLECSLHHLPSGTLPEPKIAQSRPRAPLWLPPPFTPAFR